MAGGTWTTQNKVRPGVYIRFKSGAGLGLTVGDRGVVAICEPMSWGPVGQVMTVDNGADTTPYCGYPITEPGAMFLREIFKGTNRTSAPRQVLLYRPSATGSSKASAEISPLTVTALYPGVRGNSITVIVTEDADNEDNFTVSTVVDGEIVDSQQATTVQELKANAWVTFSGTGALAANTGTPLSGGTDGTVEATAYSAFLSVIEPYDFDILIYDGTDSTVLTAMQSFVKRLADENGQYCQLVAAGMTNPDSRFVIDNETGVTLSDGTELTKQQVCWWLGGAQAGAQYNQSLTYAAYPDAVTVSPVLTNSQVVAAINAGQFTLFAEDNVVKVETDINSLVTYTQDIGKVYRKNRVIRLCNSIANDIYKQFSDNFIGVVDNDDTGRMQFRTAIVGYMTTLQNARAIQNFAAEDVEVLPGDDVDSIVVNVAIQAVDSVEKIYMTVTVS